MKSNFLIVLVVMAAANLCFFCGCGNESKGSLWDQIEQLGNEKNDLEMKVEYLEKENKELTEQTETLSALSKEVRLEALAYLERIEISKRSGLYDKDDDGVKEKLIVYVKTFDKSGDAIKAPGNIQVQLWDLNSEEGSRLGQWDIKPVELKELWAGTFMTSYYRLSFDITDKLKGNEKDLTVRVSFTDYITGRVLREQRVIK